MKRLYSLLLFTFAVNILFAQSTFEKIIGSNGNAAAYGAVQTFDGGTVISGFMYANGVTGIDLFIVKMDANGNTIWNKTYGGYNDDYTQGGFEQTTDSGFILLGYEVDSNKYYNKLIKINSYGDTLWTKVFTEGNNNFFLINSVHQVKDGGYILVGTYSDANNVTYCSLIKLDKNGAVLWSEIYTNAIFGTFNYQYCGGYDATQSNDRGFVISCYGANTFYGSNNTSSLYIIKTDSNGNETWAKQLDFEAGYYSFIQKANDGGYVLTEDATSSSFTNDGTILIKTDSTGNVQWIKSYYTTLGGLYDFFINKTDEGNYNLTGWLNNLGQPGVYGHFIKVNANGDTLMTKSFGHLFYDSQFMASCPTKEKGIVSAGFTEDSNQAKITEAYIVKTDSTGFTNCNGYYNIIETKSDSTEEDIDDIFSTSLTLNSSSWFLIVGSSGTETDLCNFNGIGEIAESDKLSIYPNPTEGIINVSISSSNILSSIQVFDVTGRSIISQSFSGNPSIPYSIDLIAQPKGYYIMKINSSEGIISRSFVLQ